MTDHLHDRVAVGDLVVSTSRVKWRPPYSLLRVASVDGDGWATSFRSIDGREQRLRGPCQTLFLVRIRAECLNAAATVARRCESVEELKRHLEPLCDLVQR